MAEDSSGHGTFIPEQFCICGLCGAHFNEPKQLGCLHSFCRICLIYYTRNSKSRNASLVCPTCNIEFKESHESFKDLPDDLFIKLLQQLSTLNVDSECSEQRSDSLDLTEFERRRNATGNRLRLLKRKNDSVCREILRKQRSDKDLEERLINEIKSFYTDLRTQILDALKEQELKALGELDRFSSKKQEDSQTSISRCRSVLELMENMEQLLGNMGPQILPSHPSSITECLLTESDKLLTLYESTLDGTEPQNRKLQFVANNDEMERTLGTVFGKLVTDDANDSVKPSEVQNLSSTAEPAPGDRNSQSSDVCYGTDLGSIDDLDNNQSDKASDRLSVTSDPNQVLSSPTVDTGRNTPGPIDRSRNDRSPSSFNRRRDNSTNSPDSPSGQRNVSRESRQYNVGIISQRSTSTTVEEELPSYWDAVGGQVPMRQNSTGGKPEASAPPWNIGVRGRNPQPPQRENFTHRSSSKTVFTSSPLKYARHARSVRVHLPDDQREGPVVGIAWLENLLVIVDRWNSKLKLFDDNGTFISSLFFADGDPWDVVTIHLISPAHAMASCAVSVPNKKMILQINVSSAGLEVFNRITTQSGYTCLSYDKCNAVFVCGVSQPFGHSQIEVISLTGQLMACFAVDAQGRRLFSQVRSIDVVVNGIIAVCDWKRNCIFFLRRDGMIIARYSGTEQYPLIEPVGTTVDERGYLMIADSKGDNIHIVDKTGKFYDVMKGSCPIIKPKEINIRPHGAPMLALSHGKFYVELFNLHAEEQRRVLPSAPAIS